MQAPEVTVRVPDISSLPFLLRPTLANLAVGHMLNGFDRLVAGAKHVSRRFGLERLARSFLR